jgi:hypothetical protein
MGRAVLGLGNDAQKKRPQRHRSTGAVKVGAKGYGPGLFENCIKPSEAPPHWPQPHRLRRSRRIRSSCVDHVIVLGEARLRRILKFYARYYNETRTHLALDKDAPVSRPVQRTGVVRSLAILGGLHHHYVRI